jgi:DNA-binding CsgD family transcriptional regulator/PAS domain-containing protein
MRETERFSALIGDIYDAALDPSRWVEALARTARFVGGPAATLYSRDVASKTVSVAYLFGMEPEYEQLYLDKYITLDPLTTGHLFSQIEVPIGAGDLLRYDEFLQTRFYQEWARPQRLVDCLHVTLDKSATSVALLSISRHRLDGAVDAEARRRMRLIVPHVRRAMLIGKVVELKKAEAATLADTLDGLSAGMFLVDARGRIVHANAAGHVMLNEADILRVASGRLTSGDPQADRTLADIFATAGAGDAAIGAKGIAVPLVARNGGRHVAHVLPLTSGARRRAGANYAAVAAVFVHEAALDMPSPPEAIAKAYKLTPSELRVLLAVVEVGGVPEVADALGVAETTVKTHLGRLYRKVGARRQADLVKVVANFSNPLRG